MSARILGLALTLLFVTGGIARAEDLKKPASAEALKHYEAGKGLFKAGRFQAAIDEYQASAQLEPSPAASFNLGQCYRMLAKLVDQDPKQKREHLGLAVFHYERFLSTTTKTPEYTAVANEQAAWSRAALADLPAVEPATPVVPTPPPSTSAAPSGAPIESPRRDDEPRSTGHWYGDVWGWGLLGTGAVGLGASGLLFWSAASLRDDANHTPIQTESESLRDRADRRALTGTIVGIGSGLVVVVAIAKLAITGDAPPRTGSASSTPRVRPAARVGLTVSARGIALFGQF